MYVHVLTSIITVSLILAPALKFYVLLLPAIQSSQAHAASYSAYVGCVHSASEERYVNPAVIVAIVTGSTTTQQRVACALRNVGEEIEPVLALKLGAIRSDMQQLHTLEVVEIQAFARAPHILCT